jgi:peptidoglycan/xylan/chitin deacetylase (PgdA/CDA1 family)
MFLRAASVLLFSIWAIVTAAWGESSGQTHNSGKAVAITIDDLPYAAGNPRHKIDTNDAKQAAAINREILTALARHQVPAIGFVNQQIVEQLGMKAGAEILKQWTTGKFELGNHFYSHPDLNQLSIAQAENEIVQGETTLVPLMKQAGKQPQFVRFPFNHTGDTKEKHDAIAAFLAGRGYRLAACTIDNSDWEFNRAYVAMLARHDTAAATKLRADYLAYTSAEIDYYAALNRQVLGYEPPEIMLLHDNQLNADTLNDVLAVFEQKQYRFVSLAEATADPVYQQPDTYITQYGMMWGYRWAAERGVKVNGRLEPEPPEWVTQYGK